MVSPLEGVAYSLTAGVARGIFGRVVPIDNGWGNHKDATEETSRNEKGEPKLASL
jgi:hypothetical protein